jgi:hypothetical protein
MQNSTDMPNLQPPRHISTLPFEDEQWEILNVSCPDRVLSSWFKQPTSKQSQKSRLLSSLWLATRHILFSPRWVVPEADLVTT